MNTIDTIRCFQVIAASTLLCAAQAHAQVTAVPTSGSAVLAAALNPSGLVVTAVTVRNGIAQQIGVYSNFTSPPVTFPAGIVLNTGDITKMIPGTTPRNYAGSGGTAEFTNFGLSTNAIKNFLSGNDVAAIDVRFTLTQPSAVKFDFLFGSTEYPTFVSNYTDAFLVFLDGLAPSNQICFDGTGAPVQVGQSFDATVTTADVNTCFGGVHGFIPSLTTTTAVLAAGEHVLTFEIGDINDSDYDSAVFISNLRAVSSTGGSSGTGGTVPTPAPTIAVAGTTAATCGLPNGAIDITVTDTASVAWTGPDGFVSSAQDLTGLAPGAYRVTATGAGGVASRDILLEGTPDTTPPSITSYPASATATAANIACTATVPDFLASVVASDDCTAAASLQLTQTPPAGTVVGIGTHPVSIVVSDTFGNSSTVSANVIVTGTPVDYYEDSDGDGVGAGAPLPACAQPLGFVVLPGDQCPLDPAKVVPGFCGCGVADIDANGNGILDCADVTLTMTRDATAVSAGGTFRLRISSSSSYYAITGYQVAVHFDVDRMNLVSVTPVEGTPFTTPIAEQTNNLLGTLRYAAGVSPGSTGMTAATDLLDLVFEVKPDADLCGTSVLAQFGSVGGFTTRLTRVGGSLVPLTDSLPPMSLDVLPPVLNGSPGYIQRPADAGSTYGAFVAEPVITVSDDCDGAIPPSLLLTFPDGTVSTAWPSDGMFPIGTSIARWTATDAAGNSSEALLVVAVLNHQVLNATVCFQGLLEVPSIRQVRFTTGSATTVVNVVMSGSCGLASNVEVPVAAGYPCIAAKDPVHSLGESGSTTIVDTHYEATVFLVQGDSNDDDMIDIVDFGMFLDDFGTGKPRDARSNFNADVHVNNLDFSFIAVNFFRTGSTCTPGANAPQPRDRISVRELRRMGLGGIADADLNLDGWVDLADVERFIQGGSAAQVSDGSQHPHP